MLSIFLLLDHNKPDWSSGKKRKHKTSYFLCYELEKVKKEEVDFWTSRHEQVNTLHTKAWIDFVLQSLGRLLDPCKTNIKWYSYFHPQIGSDTQQQSGPVLTYRKQNKQKPIIFIVGYFLLILSFLLNLANFGSYV